MRENSRNEISHLRSTLAVLQDSLKEEDVEGNTGEGFWGSPMSTQVMPGPSQSMGRSYRQSLIKLSESHSHCCPYFKPCGLVQWVPGGKASKRLFYSHIFPVLLLSMRSKGDCLEPALYPIRLIYKTEVAVPSPSYHFIQKKLITVNNTGLD